MSRTLSAALLLAVLTATTPTQAKQVVPSPGWDSAMPSGPVPGTKITEEYARLVAHPVP